MQQDVPAESSRWCGRAGNPANSAASLGSVEPGSFLCLVSLGSCVLGLQE